MDGGDAVNYRVTHKSTYHYTQRVPISYNRVCLTPRRCAYQECLSHRLDIAPTPAVLSTPVTDYFGNEVVFFTVQDPHDALEITAVSEVRLTPHLPPAPEATPPWEHVREDLRGAGNADLLDAYQFALDRTEVSVSNQLRDYTMPSFSPGTPILVGAINLMQRIYEDFAYDSTATTISTPIQEVLTHRRGVCQDFAHLQIGCMRSLGLAARYVSGYIVPLPAGASVEFVGAQASHAWLSVYAPGHGWVDLDPTNNMLPSNEHVTLGWGREYEEVSPVRGVILGGGPQLLGVAVDVERLDRQ